MNYFYDYIFLNFFPQIIAKKLGLNQWHEYKKLADVQNSLKYDLGKMLQVVSEIFHGNYYSKDEVNKIIMYFKMQT